MLTCALAVFVGNKLTQTLSHSYANAATLLNIWAGQKVNEQGREWWLQLSHGNT